MKGYQLTLKHDKGTIVIHTVAKDKNAAIQIVMDSEKCPISAITNILPIKEGLLISAFYKN